MLNSSGPRWQCVTLSKRRKRSAFTCSTSTPPESFAHGAWKGSVSGEIRIRYSLFTTSMPWSFM